MKYKIGVFGSAVDEGGKVMAKAREIGRELGKHKKQVIVVTGACSGVPYEVVNEAAKKGAEVWGYSPEINKDEQIKAYPKDNVSIYLKLIYVPKNFSLVDRQTVRRKYRNVVSTANCDAGIIISGRWGSLNEFTNLTDFGKVVGVLTGTGGMADELSELVKSIRKDNTGRVIFNSRPDKLVQGVIDELSKKVR